MLLLLFFAGQNDNEWSLFHVNLTLCQNSNSPLSHEFDRWRFTPHCIRTLVRNMIFNDFLEMTTHHSQTINGFTFMSDGKKKVSLNENR